jgi:hypothetical protein
MKGALNLSWWTYLLFFALATAACISGVGQENLFGMKIPGPWGQELTCTAGNALGALLPALIGFVYAYYFPDR